MGGLKTISTMCERGFRCVSSSEFTGERIPTLNEVVEVCEELDVVLFLELKGFDLARVL